MNIIQKQLMEKYPLMKCGNNLEFNCRLQWLSEGMLENHLIHYSNGKINQDEIKLYEEYCVIRLKHKTKKGNKND